MVELVVAMAESDCELLRSGLLAQPANALSSATFAAVGCWLLWKMRRAPGRTGFLLIIGLAMIATGAGSVAFHGPQPGWAHPVHDGSVVLLGGLFAGKSASLVARAGTRKLALNAWKATAPWAVLALSAYLAGRTGAPLCRPAGIWQPHAAWHVLSAVGLGTAARLLNDVEAPAARATGASVRALGGGWVNRRSP